MASTPIRTSPLGVFVDTTSSSESISSDSSYDFAETDDPILLAAATSIPPFSLSQDVNETTEPRASVESNQAASLLEQAESLPAVVSDSAPFSQGERITKEHQTQNWLQESQETTGESYIESVISDKPNLSSRIEETTENPDDTTPHHAVCFNVRSHFKMLADKVDQLLKDAPDHLDTPSPEILEKHLRNCSRVFFEDFERLYRPNNMTANQNEPGTGHLSGRLEIERNSVKEKEHDLGERLHTISDSICTNVSELFEAQQKIVDLEADIQRRDETIRDMEDHVSECAAELDELHDEIFEEFGAHITHLTMQFQERNMRNVRIAVSGMEKRLEAAKHEHKNAMESVRLQHVAFVREKNREYLSYQNDATQAYEAYNSFRTNLCTKHSEELLKNTEHFQSVVDNISQAHNDTILKVEKLKRAIAILDKEKKEVNTETCGVKAAGPELQASLENALEENQKIQKAPGGANEELEEVLAMFKDIENDVRDWGLLLQDVTPAVLIELGKKLQDIKTYVGDLEAMSGETKPNIFKEIHQRLKDSHEQVNDIYKTIRLSNEEGSCWRLKTLMKISDLDFQMRADEVLFRIDASRREVARLGEKVREVKYRY